MTVLFGDMNVAIVAGKTTDGRYICKFQRCSKMLTPEMLANEDYRKLADNSPCYLEFKDVKSLNTVIKALKGLKHVMIDDILNDEE